VEFSPYEIGMAKYGTFMTPDLFGSKFFRGNVIKKGCGVYGMGKIRSQDLGKGNIQTSCQQKSTAAERMCSVDFELCPLFNKTPIH